jgi:hypothetical protein
MLRRGVDYAVLCTLHRHGNAEGNGTRYFGAEFQYLGTCTSLIIFYTLDCEPIASIPLRLFRLSYRNHVPLL